MIGSSAVQHSKRFLWSVAPGVMRFKVNRRTHWKWSIGIMTGDSPLGLETPRQVNNPVLTCDDITDVHAGFVADPFMLCKDGVWYMFFEVLNLETEVGEIALAISRNGFCWEYQGIVLSGSQHFSYPHVFEFQDDYYMIPESWKSGAATLYRADPFPWRWIKVKNLLEGYRFADSSIFHHRDRWWLFSEASTPGHHGILKLFGSERPDGPWVEHPASPVVAGDICASRPAGRVITVNGRLIRFSQNPTPRYGTAVHAFEILELSPRIYRERPLGRSHVLGPGAELWNRDGMHHVDAHTQNDGSWLACVDGFRWAGI